MTIVRNRRHDDDCHYSWVDSYNVAKRKKNNQKGSELVVAFPKSSNSKSSSSSKPPSPKKPKKKTTLSGRTVRTAFIVATLLLVAPIVANELEERISIQPSAAIWPREELLDSDWEDPIVPKVEEKEMVKEAMEEESF
jgi:hypothetical protein